MAEELLEGVHSLVEALRSVTVIRTSEVKLAQSIRQLALLYRSHGHKFRAGRACTGLGGLCEVPESVWLSVGLQHCLEAILEVSGVDFEDGEIVDALLDLADFYDPNVRVQLPRSHTDAEKNALRKKEFRVNGKKLGSQESCA